MADGDRAMFVRCNLNGSMYHLIRMDQPHPNLNRRTLCGSLREISINDVVRLSKSSIPEHKRCWRCWGADQ